MSEEQREALIIPVEKIFEKYEIVTLPDFYAELAHNGASIYQKKIRTSHKNGEFVRLYDKNGFFAIGQVVEKDGESVIKPQKQFVL
jgi:tRNA U55 pseudouridine synthase TruB